MDDTVAIERAVDRIAADAIAEHTIPGLSVALMRGDRMLLAKGYGFADLEQKSAATPETIYPIGSIAKQVTAAAIMRLVEQGAVGLDEPLTRYLPEYPTQGHTILVRDLLHHTSGIREFFTVRGFGELESGSPERYSRADLIRLFQDQPFHFAPGERWAYSNSNYTLLGLLIERVSGMSYETFLQATLFQPLGFGSIHSCGSRPPSERFATGYLLEAGVPQIAPTVNRNTAIGDGGLCSSVVDLVRWKRALVTGRAVSEASYQRMIASEPVRRGYTPEYGFGLSLVPLDGRQRLGHNGEIGGYTSALAYYPEGELTVGVLTNLGLIWANSVERKIARTLLGLPAPRFRDLPVRVEERRAYAGRYDFGVFPVRVLDEEGRLWYDMRMGRAPYALLAQGDHRFVAKSEPDAIRLAFLMEGGRATRLEIEMAAMRWYAERIE